MTLIIPCRHVLKSQYVMARAVEVWCPPAAPGIIAARYPVIYMHDGQNLFDPATSFIGVDWGITEAMSRLHQQSNGLGAIVVGIWNTPLRWREYMPATKSSEGQKLPLWLMRFINEAGGEPLSEGYLKFIVEELKPFIDNTYPALTDQHQTFIMGSSMGGLISLFALIEYPEIFGGAGCLSTHWPAGGEELVDFLGQKLPKPGQHRLYFDFGTETLDANYEPYQRRMDNWVQKVGYRWGKDWVTRKFIGAEHSERAWRERVDVPLNFFLSTQISRIM